jgi:predicted ATPase
MTLEIRLLSFSTGQPHPLAEKSIIFITTKSLLLGRCNVVVDIVGEFLALLITYPMARSESEDAFFLVRWKKGEVYRVSVRRLRHVPSPSSAIAHIVFSALGTRMGSLLIFQFPLARHPRDPQLDSKNARSSQDRGR